jgi:WD40 repeat protein
MAKPNIYTTGGTVQAGGGLYITRQADHELLALCQTRTFAYILTARQMGKSSLMVRTAESLAATGTRSVIIDLSQIGVQISAEEWYLGILTTIADSLLLETDVIVWWQAHAFLGIAQRFLLYLQEVVLTEITEPIVIFVDEIDSTLHLPFTDDFYAVIRYVYNARAFVPVLQRLSFVLIGVATPSDLISDPQRTPFNIGHRVDLSDFTYEEALPLAHGLGMPPDVARAVLHQVLEWTAGHPYLTQRLCRVIADTNRQQWSEADVEQTVWSTFLGEKSEQDHNLQFVRDMLTKRAPDAAAVLAAYRAVCCGRALVKDEEQSLTTAHLKLSGVVRRDGGVLRVRNRIYEAVFNRQWIREHRGVNWKRRMQWTALGVGISFILLVIGNLGLLVERQRRLTRIEAQTRIEAETQRAETQRAMAKTQAALQETERLAYLYRNSLAQALAIQVLRHQEQLHQFDEFHALLARQAYNFAPYGLEQVDEALQIVLSAPYFSHTLQGHAAGVFSVAFSPDGHWLASASADHTVRLWDLLQPGVPPRILRGHKEEVWAVRFSPDSRMLASGSADRIIRLWSIQAPMTAPTLYQGHANGVLAVAFSPDGHTLASASADATLRLWNSFDASAPPVILHGHSGPVYSVAFSPDGSTLASASADWLIHLWAMPPSPAPPRVLAGHDGPVFSVAFNPDGHILASGSADQTVRLWDLTQPTQPPSVLRGHSAGVFSVAFSPDGYRLASDAITLVPAGEADRTIRLWDLRQLTAPSTVLQGHAAGIYTVAFSPDGHTLASGSEDQTIRLWDLQPPRLPAILRGHAADVYTVAFSPDGRTLASGSEDQTIRLWHLDTPGAFPLVLHGHEGKIWAIVFSPDGQHLASASADHTVRLWDLRHPSNLPVVFRGHEGPVYAVAFSPNGHTLVSAGEDATLRVWDLNQPATAPRILHSHTRRVWTVAWSPDGHMLASGSTDQTIHLWHLSQTDAPYRVLHGHTGEVYWLTFSPDGHTLASSSEDSTVRLWTLRDAPPTSTLLQGHTTPVFGVAFSPDGTMLASCGLDRALRWDLRRLPAEPVVLRQQARGATAVAFSPDGRVLALGGKDIFLLAVHAEAFPTVLCERVSRNLTHTEWREFVSQELPYEHTCPHLPAPPSPDGREPEGSGKAAARNPFLRYSIPVGAQ